MIKSAVGSVFNIKTSIGEVIIGVTPLSIQTTTNRIKHYLKLNINKSPEDKLMNFISHCTSEGNNKLAELKTTMKDVFKFLKWKLQVAPNHFDNIDKYIIQNQDYGNFCRLTSKSCSYTKPMFKKYIEKLWHEKLINQARMDGDQNIPKPSCHKLPIPDKTTREEEVQLMSIFYPQNLFNSFVYRHTYQTESPLCSRCKLYEETPFHVIYECSCNNYKEKIQKLVDKIVGEDAQYQDCTTLLNCSRNEEFLKVCLQVIKQGHFRREINLN